MRSTILSTASALALALNLGGVWASFVAEDGEAAPLVARSFIIEYAGAGGRSAKQRRQTAEIASTDGIKVVKAFDSDIFTGASIETATYNVDDLERLPGVVRVWLNEEVKLAPLQDQRAAAVGDALEYTTHNVTGVSKLHDQGLFGKGVKVGVVDTGIWYDHPALGGGFGAGFKVAGGWDFVGDGNYPISGPKAPDDDPIDSNGHGTHVAGIVAGKTEGWTGVAPEAELYAYKVFSQAGSTDSATLIESFLRAYEDGMDIITASIGGANGWSNNAWAEVASRLVEEGVVVTISAGNSGAIGPFYGSSGSSGRNVIAVASVSTALLPVYPFEATFTPAGGSSDTVKVGYIPARDYFPPTVVDWPIVSLSLDPTATADGCTPYPPGTPSLQGKIPLVRRGTCSFQIKQENLAALGAQYILIYNNESPITTPGTSNYTTLIAMIPAESGVSIIETLKSGGNVTADFSTVPEIPVGLPYSEGNRPNTFTSWGALYDLQLKPDIAAPGGQIFSTWVDGTYNIISGTSMACPYVAGVAALYISAKGGRSVQGKGFARVLSRRIISSGVALPWSDGTSRDYNFAAPPAQVSTGLIDAFKVLEYDTQLEFNKMELNDTRYFSRYHDVTVTNQGSSPVSYKFSSQPAAGVDTVTWGPAAVGRGVTQRIRTFDQLTPRAYEPVVSLPRDFTLRPGESKRVSVNFGNPDTLGWNASALPLYGGKVVVAGSNGEVLSVPYMGVGADLRNQLGSIVETGFPYVVSGLNNTLIEDKNWFTFNLSLGSQDFPKSTIKLLWGTRQIRWDIFEPTWTERNWVYPPVVGENGYVGTATQHVKSSAGAFFDPSLDDPDQASPFPILDVARTQLPSVYQSWWLGKLGNGSQIAEGRYMMRVAVLKPFGNPRAADNWDVLRTPVFEVRGKY
ncbi:hypothetical protein MCOR21_005284 [Pyricularia oryzae]|nr:hypothetical protein MCOR21_005284 [Pyricularia oryzae]